MRRVILESPYAGDVDANVAYARRCILDCLSRGESPIASHLLYTQPGVLDDKAEDERALGIEAGLAWLPVADAMVVYMDRGISPGMQAAMDVVSGYPIPIPIERRSLAGEPPDHHVDRFLGAALLACQGLRVSCADRIEAMAVALQQLRARAGRLFIVGLGGSAANASHAVNDFRKKCRIEAYAPTDNVAELTARANDNGWDTVFADWLAMSQMTDKDVLLVFSVGGGSRMASACIVEAVRYATQRGALVFGVVGSEQGYTAKHGDIVIVVPEVDHNWITPLTESMQSVVWHCLVNHPLLEGTDA